MTCGPVREWIVVGNINRRWQLTNFVGIAVGIGVLMGIVALLGPALDAAAVGVLLHVLLRNLTIYNKVKATLHSVWEGIASLRHVRHVTLFILMSLGIWACYFLHYYVTFFCFPFTESLGVGCGLVTFLIGSIAVVVPTPNGAGPWHFAVKTMLLLYGVQEEQALYFVLIVHTLQTMFVILLGIYGWARLSLMPRSNQ